MNGQDARNEVQKFNQGLQVSKPIIRSVVSGLVAGTTQTQAGAVKARAELISVATTANASDGVQLPVAELGQMIAVTNAGAENLKIWPATGGKCNGGTADAADTTLLATTKTRFYFCFTAGDWTKANVE